MTRTPQHSRSVLHERSQRTRRRMLLTLAETAPDLWPSLARSMCWTAFGHHDFPEGLELQIASETFEKKCRWNRSRSGEDVVENLQDAELWVPLLRPAATLDSTAQPQ